MLMMLVGVGFHHRPRGYKGVHLIEVSPLQELSVSDCIELLGTFGVGFLNNMLHVFLSPATSGRKPKKGAKNTNNC